SGTRHEVVFFDVKTEPTVKLCIRAAVGQLLEYSYYPSEERATNLIVVGCGLARTGFAETSAGSAFHRTLPPSRLLAPNSFRVVRQNEAALRRTLPRV